MLNNTCHATSSDTLSYHHKSNKWDSLPSSGIPRFLHSAVLVANKTMIVYGGRGVHGLLSQNLMVFDIGECLISKCESAIIHVQQRGQGTRPEICYLKPQIIQIAVQHLASKSKPNICSCFWFAIDTNQMETMYYSLAFYSQECLQRYKYTIKFTNIKTHLSSKHIIFY